MAQDDTTNLVRLVIGRNICALREAGGLNETQFAEMVGINRSYYCCIEGGKENPSLKMLVKIADGLDVPISMLFEGLDACAPRKLQPDIAYAAVRVPKKTRSAD